MGLNHRSYLCFLISPPPPSLIGAIFSFIGFSDSLKHWIRLARKIALPGFLKFSQIHINHSFQASNIQFNGLPCKTMMMQRLSISDAKSIHRICTNAFTLCYIPSLPGRVKPWILQGGAGGLLDTTKKCKAFTELKTASGQ